MKYALLTFDLEEFAYPVESGQILQKEPLFDLSKTGFDRLLKVLDFKATFFTTEEYADRFPNQISKLVALGQEIGFHGVTHKQETDYAALHKARKNLENRFGIKLLGFRPPQFSKIDPKKLKRIGFYYTSATHPRIGSGQWFLPRKINYISGIIEVPVSTTPLLRLPFSWVWFRNLGLSYAKACTLNVLAGSPYVMLYFHPWDFSDLALSGYKMPYYFKRRAGEWMEKSLPLYADWLKRNGINPVRIRDFLRLNEP